MPAEPNPTDLSAMGRGSPSDLPPGTTLRGDPAILDRPALALFCSVRCPGALILRTYDLVRALRDAGVTVVGGFHTPMEQECLALLLRGPQPVIVCPARGIEGMRLPAAWKAPLAEGRLLIASPFPAAARRVTAALAAKRNALIARLAARVFVAHAAPGGQTERFCREVVALAKPLLTFADPANANLLALGARPMRPDDLRAALR